MEHDCHSDFNKNGNKWSAIFLIQNTREWHQAHQWELGEDGSKSSKAFTLSEPGWKLGRSCLMGCTVWLCWRSTEMMLTGGSGAHKKNELKCILGMLQRMNGKGHVWKWWAWVILYTLLESHINQGKLPGKIPWLVATSQSYLGDNVVVRFAHTLFI